MNGGVSFNILTHSDYCHAERLFISSVTLVSVMEWGLAYVNWIFQKVIFHNFLNFVNFKMGVLVFIGASWNFVKPFNG